MALNLTVVEGVNPTIGGGFVTVYPCGARPDASNLNFTTGQTIPNSVIAPVSAGGDICFFVYGTAHLLADISGYFPTGSGFASLSPSRVLDTRGSSKVGAADGSGLPLMLNVLNKGGLPGSGIGAVALNLTVVEGVNPTIGGGFVTVCIVGARPDASNELHDQGRPSPTRSSLPCLRVVTSVSSCTAPPTCWLTSRATSPRRCRCRRPLHRPRRLPQPRLPQPRLPRRVCRSRCSPCNASRERWTW